MKELHNPQELALCPAVADLNHSTYTDSPNQFCRNLCSPGFSGSAVSRAAHCLLAHLVSRAAPSRVSLLCSLTYERNEATRNACSNDRGVKFRGCSMPHEAHAAQKLNLHMRSRSIASQLRFAGGKPLSMTEPSRTRGTAGCPSSWGTRA